MSHNHNMAAIAEEKALSCFRDSIIDCDRNRDNPRCLGYGSAMFIASRYLAKYPDHPVEFINRGVSGDRTCDLKARWDRIKLKPDLVSILIGINDVGGAMTTIR